MPEIPEDLEANYRAWVLFLIIAGALLYFIIPPIYDSITAIPNDMYRDASGKLIPIPSGFIRDASGTPVPLIIPTPIIIYQNVTITPTPDNGVYYVSDEQSGARKMGRYFVFHRDNVTGYKSLDFHVTIYGFKMLDTYHWYNWHDGQWYETQPDNPDNKFLFVYVQLYTDDLSGDDVRNFIPDQEHFQVNYLNTMYMPIPFEKDLDIHELEDTYTLNDDGRIQYYAQFIKQQIAGSNGGEISSISLYYSFGGKSNAVDGYIVYSIPKSADASQLMVYGDFFTYGNSQWVLKT